MEYTAIYETLKDMIMTLKNNPIETIKGLGGEMTEIGGMIKNYLSNTAIFDTLISELPFLALILEFIPGNLSVVSLVIVLLVYFIYENYMSLDKVKQMLYSNLKGLGDKYYKMIKDVLSKI